MLGLREVYRQFFEPTSEAEAADLKMREWASGVLLTHEDGYFKELLAKIEALSRRRLIAGGDLAALAGQIGVQNGINEVLSVIRSDLDAAIRISGSAAPKEQDAP